MSGRQFWVQVRQFDYLGGSFVVRGGSLTDGEAVLGAGEAV